MKYLGIISVGGMNKVKCEKKDGTIKSYTATEDVLKELENNIKIDDLINVEFDKETYIMCSVKKFIPKKELYTNVKNGYQPSFKKQGTNYDETILERATLASAMSLAGELNDVNSNNVEEVVIKLYNLGLKLIKNKVEVKSNNDLEILE